MALESVKNILEMANRANTSVISFICIDYNMVYSVIKTAEKTNTPALVMLLPEHAEQNSVFHKKAFAEMVKALAHDVKVPIGLHLDHSYEYGGIISAIQAGFSSVMIDGSMRPLEENIRLTQKVVETAHLLGACVEAELGQIGLETGESEKNEAQYTDAKSAEMFCKETGIDSLAISIGNAHGVYREEPHLDIKRLEEIHALTNNIPLVLHGGSGIPDEQLKIAFKKGINKFNVGTEFLEEYYQALSAYTKLKEHDDGAFRMLDVPAFVQEKLQAYLEKKLQLSEL